MKSDINLIYICIWERAKAKAIAGEIPMKDFLIILHKVYRIPKKFVYPIIKDMEKDGLVEWISRSRLKILDIDIDLENTSELYKDLNFF